MQTLKKSVEDDPLPLTLQCLRAALNMYSQPFLEHVVPRLNLEERNITFTRLEESFRTIVGHSLPSKRISILLDSTFRETIVDILGISQARDEQEDDDDSDEMQADEQYSITYRMWKDLSTATARLEIMSEFDDPRRGMAMQKLLFILNKMNDYGLGGSRAQKIFARVMNDMMTEFIIVNYEDQWDSPSLAKEHLCLWVENIFARLAVEVLGFLQTSVLDLNNVDDLIDVRFDDEVEVCCVMKCSRGVVGWCDELDDRLVWR